MGGGKTHSFYNMISLEANSAAIIAGINLKRIIWPCDNGKRNIYWKDIKLAILIPLWKSVSTRNEAFVFLGKGGAERAHNSYLYLILLAVMGVAVPAPFTALTWVAVPREICWLFVLGEDQRLATGSKMIGDSQAYLQVCFAPTQLFDSVT